MTTIELQFLNTTKRFFLPTGYEELSRDKYVKAIGLMKRAETKPSAQWLLLLYLSGMSVSDLEILNAVQRVELLSKLEFLFDLDTLPSKCMIKKVSFKSAKGFLTMLGPGDVLRHLTFGEFVMAETRLERYERTGSAGDLNQFLGVLYRPADKSRTNFADQRQVYNPQLVDHYGKMFESVDPAVKVAILMNYHGMKSMLPRMFGNVFPKPKQGNNQEKKPAPAKASAALNWLKILSSMADMDVTKYPDIEAMSMHTVLFNLNETIDRNQKVKAEMENMRR